MAFRFLDGRHHLRQQPGKRAGVRVQPVGTDHQVEPPGGAAGDGDVREPDLLDAVRVVTRDLSP